MFIQFGNDPYNFGEIYNVADAISSEGKAGQKMKVTYDANVSFGSVLKHLDVLTGDELRAYATGAGQSAKSNYYLMNDNVDWFDQIYRTAISTDHNISITGGTKNMPYRAAIGYTNQNGVIKTEIKIKGED